MDHDLQDLLESAVQLFKLGHPHAISNDVSAAPTKAVQPGDAAMPAIDWRCIMPSVEPHHVGIGDARMDELREGFLTRERSDFWFSGHLHQWRSMPDWCDDVTPQLLDLRLDPADFF